MTLQSALDPPDVLGRIAEDLGTLRAVPGLLEKFFLRDRDTGDLRGFYVFASADDRERYLASDYVAALPERYAVPADSLRVERLDLAGTLNGSVAAAVA